MRAPKDLDPDFLRDVRGKVGIMTDQATHDNVDMRRMTGPKGPHRRDVVLRAPTAIAEVGTEQLELLPQPTDPDTQLHPAATELVKRCQLFGEQDRLALRHHENPGTKPDRRTYTGNECQPGERLGEGRHRRAGRQRPVGRVRVFRRHRRGPDDVLYRPKGVEAQRLGSVHDDPRCLGRPASDDVRSRETELHESTSSPLVLALPTAMASAGSRRPGTA